MITEMQVGKLYRFTAPPGTEMRDWSSEMNAWRDGLVRRCLGKDKSGAFTFEGVPGRFWYYLSSSGHLEHFTEIPEDDTTYPRWCSAQITEMKTGKLYRFTAPPGTEMHNWTDYMNAWRDGLVRRCLNITVSGRAVFEGIEGTWAYTKACGHLKHFTEVPEDDTTYPRWRPTKPGSAAPGVTSYCFVEVNASKNPLREDTFRINKQQALNKVLSIL